MFDRYDIVNEADFVPIMYSLLYRVSFKKYSTDRVLRGAIVPSETAPFLMAG